MEGRALDYPRLKLLLNREANLFLKLLFNIQLNDTTNAFKAFRRDVAIVRGYNWTVIPITWRNRTGGISKFQLKKMGIGHLFICLYLWLEKYFSRGD
jgi:dolichol-phosphate mannosyltransferase